VDSGHGDYGKGEPDLSRVNANPPDEQPAGRRSALRPVLDLLNQSGFYAYSTVDHESRWIVACDTELGRIDVRLGVDGYRLDVWDTSPGLFLEEENGQRREAMERLARVSIPAIARGFLSEEQEIWWDEETRGVGARIKTELPFAAQLNLAEIARARLLELNDLIAFVEQRLTD
jgi:hypothetical protein